MIIGSVDRIEEGIIIVLTHTEPVQRIPLPLVLFPDLEEGDVVEISVEKNKVRAQEIRDRIVKLREGLNQVEL